MTNQKSTKRALISSAIALVVCISMLIGTTFAWFTDNVSSANNKIVAGNLKVDLSVYTKKADDTFEWVSVKTSNAPIFDYQLWEPGYVLAKLLKVENLGTLDLKWQAAIVNNGELSILADVIDVYVKPLATEEEYKALTRETLSTWEKVGTIREFISTISSTTTGTLTAKASANLGIALKMREEAGNQYMDKTIGTFDIKIFATQLASEFDSFNNQYDAGAYLPVVKTAEELKNALADGQSVKLGANIISTEPLPVADDVVLDLNGYALTNTNTMDGLPLHLTDGKLTVTNGTLALDGSAESGFGTYNSAIGYEGGTELVVEGVKFEGITGINGSFEKDAAVNISVSNSKFNVQSVGIAVSTGSAQSVATVTNCDITAGQFAVLGSQGAKITIKGGTYTSNVAVFAQDADTTVTIEGGTFKGALNESNSGKIIIKGGTFDNDPSAFVAEGHVPTNNGNGTWTVERVYIQVAPSTENATAADNGVALGEAINNTTEASYIQLAKGEYKMPSISGSKEVTLVGTKDTVIDLTLGAYMDSSTVSFEGITIKGSRGKANGNGSDDAAFYTPNVTYTNCTFDGPFAVGRDGATFINCEFTNLGNDYVWNMACNTVFDGCTFNSEGKALLLYSHGSDEGDEMTNVVVKNCKFNATQPAKAAAINNQPCAAIEIHNYGCGFNLITSGNTVSSNFSGEWRIKQYDNRSPLYTVTINGTAYTTTALDGRLMTVVNSEASFID